MKDENFYLKKIDSILDVDNYLFSKMELKLIQINDIIIRWKKNYMKINRKENDR